jgi:hypothetical protein
MTTSEQRVFLPQVLPLSIYLADVKLFAPEQVLEVVQEAYNLGHSSYRILTPNMARKLMDYCNLFDCWDIYNAEDIKEIKALSKSKVA